VKRYAHALEWLVAATLAVTVFAFAAGSSIEYHVLLYARTYRWVCLFVLLGLALVSAAVSGPRNRLPWGFLALAAALVALTLASATWSVDPSLTLRRAGSLVVLFSIAVALLLVSPRRVSMGLLAGAVAVGIAGVGTLALDHDAAVQPASTQYPARFQGFEQNPDTAALLFALAIPLAVYLLLTARTFTARLLLTAALLLFAGSITASGARGPMLGALVGTLVVVVATAGGRGRLVLAGLTIAVFAACVGISRIPQAKPVPPSGSNGPTIRRTLFTSSGRRAAWAGALHQAEDRPVAGYGFGTEALVFVDRYADFDSDLVENSYIGAVLQLGIAGLALLLGIAVVALGTFARAPARGVQAAFAGAAVAALVVAITQSFLFSVGNIATATAWISLFLVAGHRAPATSSERIASREIATAHSG
jgi:putative inorganic carbon (hco3(-)) transporter